MRFFYVDSGLSDNIGHNANTCRLIAGELKRRGIETRIFAAQTVGPGLGGELGAAAHFRCHAFWQSDGDPVCGWLTAFHVSARVTFEDLARMGDVAADDVVYVNSAMPPQFMATIQWLGSLPPARRPRVVMEFGVDPGIVMGGGPDGKGWSLREGEAGQRAVLFRFVAKHLRGDGMPQLKLATFDKDSSLAYSTLLDRPLEVLPVPREAGRPPRRRSMRRPLTIGVVGHQRAEKGYHLMPEVARLLLAAHSDIRLLVHNSAPGEMPKTRQALKQLATADARLAIDERAMGPGPWADLLESLDLVLCPYFPERFATSYSSVASEALASGLPMIVPAGTSLSRTMAEQDGAGTTFARFDPPSIAAAVSQAVTQADDLAERAMAAAETWRAGHGARAAVDAILALAKA